jgi:predicted dehydrogenase
MKTGEAFELKNEDWLVSVLEFASGLRARLTANFYVGGPAENRAGLEIHGDTGSVSTAWFSAASPVRLGKFGGSYHPVIPVRPSAGFGDWYCDWSAGVVGLWRGLRTNTAHPTSGAQGAHVVEIMEAVHRSAREGKAISLVGSFTPPEPQPWATSHHAGK